MINIAICDDETVFAESLSVQIRNEIIQNNETCTEYICSNGTTLIELCQNESIDVAFVDISMPEMNGFDIAEKLRTKQKYIVGICFRKRPTCFSVIRIPTVLVYS